MSRVDKVRAMYEPMLAAAENSEAMRRGWLPPLPPHDDLDVEPLAWTTGPCGSAVVHPTGVCPSCHQRLLPEIPNPKDDPPGWRPAPPHERRIGIYAIVDPEPDDDGGWWGTLVNACTLPIDPPWPCSGAHRRR